MEQAILFLEKKPKIIPEFNSNNLEECFRIALLSFGYKNAKLYNSKFINSFENYDVKNELNKYNGTSSFQDILMSKQKFHNLIFNEGIKLRYMYPMIYVLPGYYFKNKQVRKNWENITRPPFIINNEKLFIPYDLDRLEWYGYSCALNSIIKSILSELARKGTMKEGINITNKLFFFYPDYVNIDQFKKDLILILGKNFKNYINNNIRRVK